MKTKVAENAGSATIFQDLGYKWKFIMFENTFVHVAAWSGDSAIGQVDLNIQVLS